MLKKVKVDQALFVPHLESMIIHPIKINIVHFFSYTNNNFGLSKALSIGCPYFKDNRNNSPLEYAIVRKSYECSTILLDYIMNT